METQKSKRIFEYDLMRVIFSSMVLGIHILAKIRGLSKPYNTTWYFVNIITNFFMICNPLFFMLSGKFNLKKNFDKKDAYIKFYKSKFMGIVIPFVVTSILIYILSDYKTKTIVDFVKNFINDNIEGTYWFVYSLIGMITISPFLTKMISNMNLTDKKILFWMSTIIVGIITTLSIVKVKSAFTLTLFGVFYWNLYYIIGAFIEEIFSTKKSRRIMICIGIIAFIIQFLIERFYESGYRLYNPSPILTFEAISIYFIILEFIKIKNNVIRMIISFIAKHTYSFYLLHAFVIKLVFEYAKFSLNVNPKINLLYGLISYIITFIITLLLAILLDFILGIPKYVQKTK